MSSLQLQFCCTSCIC